MTKGIRVSDNEMQQQFSQHKQANIAFPHLNYLRTQKIIEKAQKRLDVCLKCSSKTNEKKQRSKFLVNYLKGTPLDVLPDNLDNSIKMFYNNSNKTKS